MNRPNGYSLLVVLVLMALSGFALRQLTTDKRFAHQLTLEQQARESQILDDIKASLLSFAGSQGIHSQSHLGHLPCPADLPEQPPKTTCLNKAWGYLPAHSSFSVNYLNLGLNTRNNERENSAQRHWHYAVSAQLLQANALGWSRWVDYTQAAMQVRVKADNPQIYTDIAAVVAAKIERLAEHQYEVTGPYRLISVSELQHQMSTFQAHQIKDTLTAWVQLSTSAGTAPAPHENLKQSPSQIYAYTPVNSNCSCRCTRTRCTCQCEHLGNWVSPGSCLGTNPDCVEHEAHSECTSAEGKVCVMSGSARLKSNWPVSRFEPVAASNKSCRPISRHECPLARDSAACTCDFSWPDNTKDKLAHFQVSVDTNSRIAVRRVQP